MRQARGPHTHTHPTMFAAWPVMRGGGCRRTTQRCKHRRRRLPRHALPSRTTHRLAQGLLHRQHEGRAGLCQRLPLGWPAGARMLGGGWAQQAAAAAVARVTARHALDKLQLLRMFKRACDRGDAAAPNLHSTPSSANLDQCLAPQPSAPIAMASRASYS